MAKVNLANLIAGLGQGSASILNAYTANKKAQASKAILDNPNSTPLQKAQAIADLGGGPLAAQYYKQTAMAERGQQIANNYPNLPGGAGFTPNAPSMAARNAVQPNAPMMQNFIPQPQGGPEMAQPEQIAPQGMQIAPAPTPEQDLATADQFRKRAADYAAAGMKPQADVDLAEANAIEKRVANKQKIAQQTFSSERDFATKMSQDFRDRMSGLRGSKFIKEQAINLAKSAIESGEVGALSPANIAQRLGMPELMSPSGTALSFAGKENLVGNLERVSGRAQNKWIEQVMSGAFPRIGQSENANKTVLEGVEASQALADAELQIYDQLAEQDMKKLGYVDKDIESRVHKALDPVAKDILNRTSYRTRVYFENEKSNKQLLKIADKKAPNGAYLTRRMFQIYLAKAHSPEKAIEAAKRQGYIIPTNSQVDEWIE